MSEKPINEFLDELKEEIKLAPKLFRQFEQLQEEIGFCRKFESDRNKKLQLYANGLENAQGYLDGKIEQLQDTLQSLVDIQNGSPLVCDQEKWQEIMDRAYKLLGI